MNAHAVICLFTYFLVRENEGATARRADISINSVSKKVLWRLSVSKMDPAALGCERRQGLHLHR